MNQPQKKKHPLHYKQMWVGILLVMVSLAGIYFLKPEPTANLIFSEQKYTWDFSAPAYYYYNASTINLTEKTVSLKLQENITVITEKSYPDTSLTKAIYDGTDVLSKLNAKDANAQDAKTGRDFEITFADTINNGDVVGIYMESGKKTGSIYLCAQNANCNSPGYGAVAYNASAGWFNISVSGLSVPANSFRVVVDNTFTFNQIKATYQKVTEKTITNYYYPNYALIETQDLAVGNLSKWKIFSASEITNGQPIYYQYTTDSWQSWMQIGPGADLGIIANATSGKIKFRATLTSDGVKTPLLYWMSISYDTSGNEEPNLPVIPNQTCTESWTCSEWSFCLKETELQQRICTDANACGTVDNQPQITQTCIYMPTLFDFPNMTMPIFGYLGVEKNRTTSVRSNGHGLEISIMPKETVYNITFGMNSANNTTRPIANISEKPAKFAEINISDNLQQELDWGIIKISYTDEDLQKNSLNESTLKIYFYNETTGSWVVIPSFVNTTGKYIWANVSHFSTYGVFGAELQSSSGNPEQPSAPSSPSGGGGGGGGGGGPSAIIEVPLVKEGAVEKKAEPKKEAPKAKIESTPKEAETTEKLPPLAKAGEKPTESEQPTLTAFQIFLSRINLRFVAPVFALIAAIAAVWIYSKKKRAK